MINEIIKGIAIKLDELFEKNIPKNSEDIKQGLKGPCFLVTLINAIPEPVVGTRKFHRNCFDIQYFPKSSGNRAEMQNVAFELIEGMEIITLPDGTKIRGTNMNYETVDGVLHFFVNYNTFTIKITEKVPMEEIEKHRFKLGE